MPGFLGQGGAGAGPKGESSLLWLSFLALMVSFCCPGGFRPAGFAN